MTEFLRMISYRGMLEAILVAVIVIVSAANAEAKGHHPRGHGHHNHVTPPQATKTDVPIGVGVSLDQTDPHSSQQQTALFANNRGNQLSQNFYAFTCPLLKPIVASTVQNLIRADNTLPAAFLRLHFHDCMVRGCDGSVLINGTDTELYAVGNKGSLRGVQQFEQIKVAVENACPGIVSCADLIALVARDAIYYSSGAFWQVPMGRRDGLISLASEANAALPSPFFNYDQLVASFQQVGLSEQDMVILSGAHTIGFTHCAVVLNRLYNYPNTPDGVDPTLDTNYAARLRRECPLATSAFTLIPLDPTGGNQTFDSQYFVRLLNNKGLLPSDAALITNSHGESIVEQEAGNIFSPNGRFFYSFGNSMEKLGQVNVLTGTQGEIHQHCYALNSQSS